MIEAPLPTLFDRLRSFDVLDAPEPRLKSLFDVLEMIEVSNEALDSPAVREEVIEERDDFDLLLAAVLERELTLLSNAGGLKTLLL